MTSTNAIAYEAVQRVFRNAVVDHVRTRLTKRYGASEAEARIAKAFPSWAEIRLERARKVPSAYIA